MPTRILLPLIVACALFMENLDSTILSTALPAIAADLGESPITLKLALTSYLLSLAVFIPASGFLADRFSARTVFRLAIATFAVGSIFCALSQTTAQLVAARVLQGMGGAMMVPVGRLLILRSVEKSELVKSMAWLTVPALIGPIAGPPLGGFITTFYDWRWVFWINVPIAVLGIALATVFIPDVRGDAGRRFDGIGFALSGLGLASFITASTSLGLGVLGPLTLIALFAFGSLLLGLYVRHHARHPDAILSLSLLRIRSFRLTLLGGALFRMGVGATPFLLPLLLQLSFGMTPFESGLVTFASAIGAITMKFAAAPLLQLFGFRRLLTGNAVPATLFIALPALFTPATPIPLMLGLLVAGGFFRSLQFTLVNTLVYADVPPEAMSRATSLVAVVQQLALSLGISIGAIALQLAGATASGFATSTFAPAFIVVGLVAGLSWLFFMRLPHDAGIEMAGNGQAKDTRNDMTETARRARLRPSEDGQTNEP